MYGFDQQGFLDALRAGGIDLLVDVRQRRGVRGSRYAWANARRLEAALAETRIGYRQMKELAPTTEMRQIQYHEDARQGEGQRSRSALAEEFADRYEREILDRADLSPLAQLARESRPALLCVEQDPDACHRSLIASRLRRDEGLTVAHLVP